MILTPLLFSLLMLVAGGGICAAWRGPGNGVSRLGAAIAAIAALLAAWPAAAVLWTGQTLSLRLPWAVPFGAFHVAVDPLSALFILVISVVCALSALYGVAYLKHWAGHKHLGAVWCFFLLLFACMLLVVMARNGVLFLMAWEGMSLASFFLVMFEHEKPEVRQAGWIYLTAAHLGAACLLVLFLLMAGSGGDLGFDQVAPVGSVANGALFALAVLGFGSKAGFPPLHVWLPEAHPVAPSHVSAVMSGVMIKTGIYGLVRVTSLLGPPAPWWGWTLLTIGAAAGIMGVLFALAQRDMKRLLAYSSVENIGIICLGLGMWLLGVAYQRPNMAVLGLMGALLHTCNHALFKGSLFLGAGAVIHATGTGNMELLGGLQKRMPHTALAFVIGSAAICGLPPLNGFVGEFLLYMGAYGTMTEIHVLNGPVAGGLVVILSLALIGGLAVVCFTKAFGIVFLGEPRGDHAVGAHEAPLPMRWAMSILAGLCLLAGLAGSLAVGIVVPVAEQLLGASSVSAAASMSRRLLEYVGMAGGSLILFAVAAWAFRKWLSAGREVNFGPTWDCGYAVPDAKMQYTSSSFAWPVINMFRWLVRPSGYVRMEKKIFPKQAQLLSHTGDIFQEALFTPLFRSITTLARWMHWLQQGRNQFYVLYIAITILALLLLKVR